MFWLFIFKFKLSLDFCVLLLDGVRCFVVGCSMLSDMLSFFLFVCVFCEMSGFVFFVWVSFGVVCVCADGDVGDSEKASIDGVLSVPITSSSACS